MRKIYFEAKVKIVVSVDEGVEADEIIGSLDLGGVDCEDDRMELLDFYIDEYEITDSK
jgi:hypothetical protein